MSDIIRDVDEALKQERMERLWQENKNLIFGLIAAIILGTALGAAWKYYDRIQDEKNTAALYEKLQALGEEEKDIALVKDYFTGKDGNDLVNLAENPEDTKVLENLSVNPSSPWQYHAMLYKAEANAKAGNYDAAVETLRKIENDFKAPAPLKDIAEKLAHVYALKSLKTEGAQ